MFDFNNNDETIDVDMTTGTSVLVVSLRNKPKSIDVSILYESASKFSLIIIFPKKPSSRTKTNYEGSEKALVTL